MNRIFSNDLRRPKAHLSPYIINYLYERNPWKVVWWSTAFPGAGYLLLCKYFTGAMLIIWELFINFQAHINEAILYSLIGEFEMAKAVIDTRWFLIYITVYIFQLRNCYKLTKDLNKISRIADRVESPILPFNMSPLEISYLDYRKPWEGAIWGFTNPGLESIYANRLPTGMIMLICFIITVYQSNVLPAIHLTFTGNTEMARAVINSQWYLNIPSLMLFAVSSGYNDIKYTNHLFKVEQSRYLAGHYQPAPFIMPNKKKENFMHFISSFEYRSFLEVTISDLEQIGISKENIFVAPLNKKSPFKSNVDPFQGSTSEYELSFILGMIFMLLGGIYGFILEWGPIIWSLIGLVFGFILGLLLSFIFMKYRWRQKNTETPTEVILIVECEKQQSDIVEQLLWRHNALGVTKTS